MLFRLNIFYSGCADQPQRRNPSSESPSLSFGSEGIGATETRVTGKSIILGIAPKESSCTCKCGANYIVKLDQKGKSFLL